jgi:hypothetical protein
MHEIKRRCLCCWEVYREGRKALQGPECTEAFRQESQRRRPGVLSSRGERAPTQLGSIEPISAQLAGDLLRCQHHQAHGFFNR